LAIYFIHILAGVLGIFKSSIGEKEESFMAEEKEILRLLLLGRDRDKKHILNAADSVKRRISECVSEMRDALRMARGHNDDLTSIKAQLALLGKDFRQVDPYIISEDEVADLKRLIMEMQGLI
jgi:signal transduction histidine kinase